MRSVTVKVSNVSNNIYEINISFRAKIHFVVLYLLILARPITGRSAPRLRSLVEYGPFYLYLP